MNFYFTLVKNCFILISVAKQRSFDFTMRLDSNSHSVFNMNYHLVFCIKYRRKVIDDTISDRLKEIFERIGTNYKITLVEWENDNDHIHALIKGEPKTEMSKFINAYKSASSRPVTYSQPPRPE